MQVWTHGIVFERAAAAAALVGVGGCSCDFGQRCVMLEPPGGAVQPVLIGSFHELSHPVVVECTNPPELKLVYGTKRFGLDIGDFHGLGQQYGQVATPADPRVRWPRGPAAPARSPRTPRRPHPATPLRLLATLPRPATPSTAPRGAQHSHSHRHRHSRRVRGRVTDAYRHPLRYRYPHYRTVVFELSSHRVACAT